MSDERIEKFIQNFMVFKSENDVDEWINARGYRLSEINNIIRWGNTYIREETKKRYLYFIENNGLFDEDPVEFPLSSSIDPNQNKALEKTGIGAGIGVTAALLLGGPLGWAAIGGAAVGLGVGRNKNFQLLRARLISNSRIAAEAYVERLLSVLYEEYQAEQIQNSPHINNHRLDLQNKIYTLFAESGELFTELVYCVENCKHVNYVAVGKLKKKLMEYEQALVAGYRDSLLQNSPMITLGCEMYDQFKSRMHILMEYGEDVPDAVFLCEFLSFAASLRNIIAVIDHWCDDPVGGHGKTLVKILPAQECIGKATILDVLDNKEFPIYFAPNIPFYIPCVNGSFSFLVLDAKTKKETLINKDDAVLGFEERMLYPPQNGNDYVLFKSY